MKSNECACVLVEKPGHIPGDDRTVKRDNYYKHGCAQKSELYNYFLGGSIRKQSDGTRIAITCLWIRAQPNVGQALASTAMGLIALIISTAYQSAVLVVGLRILKHTLWLS